MSTTAVVAVLAAVLGACVGSFLNVVAWRLPREESVVHPRSHCPNCGSPLRWFENVPLLSWMVLRARCRHCGSAISARYPAVELLTAGLFVATALGNPSALAAPPAWLLRLCGRRRLLPVWTAVAAMVAGVTRFGSARAGGSFAS
jgi:leader peptidase (prepilin peptidase)/N-methyltransferase